MKSLLCFVTLIVALVAVCQNSNAANVALNPGFETAGATPQMAADWFGGATVGTAERSDVTANSGDWSFYISSGPTDLTFRSGVVQSADPNVLDVTSLQELTEVSVSFWVNHNRGTGEIGRARIELLNSASAVVSSTINGIALQDTAGQWVEQTIDPFTVPAFGPAPNDAYYYQISFTVDTDNVPNSFIEAYIDDVVIDATFVPESVPMCWPIVAFIGPLITRRSRRRAYRE